MADPVRTTPPEQPGDSAADSMASMRGEGKEEIHLMDC